MIKEIVENQRNYYTTGATRSIAFRLQQLRKFEKLIQENETELNAAIYADFKKSPFDNYTNELALVLGEIKQARKKLKRWARPKRVRTNFINFPAKSYVIPEPLGVSLVIGAWNYPYQLSLGPAVAAMAAGNTIIIKPSELPSHTSAAMAQLINENFDPNYFKVVEGGIPETTELLDQKFDKIFFTGSGNVGRIVYQAAAKHLTPVTLELGGKSPAFISKNCNLKMTVRRLVWAKFLNSGQTCIAPDYILVDKAIEKQFLEMVKAEIEASHFSVENENYVQIINDRNLDRLEALIDVDKVYYGGKIDRNNRMLEPTVMHNVSFDDKVMEDEIFGPILPVISYNNLNEAIEWVKKLPKPLSCYAFTNQKAEKEKILAEISFGGGGINEAVMHITNDHLPFGGVGGSGTGAYHGEHGFKAFSHYKSVLDKPTWFETNLKYYPHSAKKFKWIRRIQNL